MAWVRTSAAVSFSAGDDVGVVGVASPGEQRVDTTAVDEAVDEEEPDIDGAALGGVTGLGVPELEILGDVVSGKPHRSGASGDGDGTVTVDVFDRPVVPVLHHDPAVGAQGALVAAGHDFVADEQSLSAEVEGGPVGVELMSVDASLLRKFVEAVDGVVGVGHQRHRLPPLSGVAPRVDDGDLHLVGGAVVESTVMPIFVDHADVARAETAGGGAFPLVGEAVDVVEFDGATGVDEVGEHAAASDGGELAGIPHHHHPPRHVFGETYQGGELRGGDGAGFVHDHRRPSGQVIPSGCGGRSGRACSYRSLSNVSAAMVVSVPSTSAAAAVGATPNTVWPRSWR